jgi:hypothetical protein
MTPKLKFRERGICMEANKMAIDERTVENGYPESVTTRIVRGKEYVVRSVFLGKQDIQSAILKLAAKKAIEEMGL